MQGESFYLPQTPFPGPTCSPLAARDRLDDPSPCRQNGLRKTVPFFVARLGNPPTPLDRRPRSFIFPFVPRRRRRWISLILLAVRRGVVSHVKPTQSRGLRSFFYSEVPLSTA